MRPISSGSPFLAPALVAVVAANAADAEVITVSVSSFAFTPSTVTAAPGDTIRWVRVSGSHTATSGSPCEPSGTFDLPVNSMFASATWVVPASEAGTTIPYYCAPHCFSMQGSIVVTKPSHGPDLDGDGFVNGVDLGILLGAWGPGDGPADLDGDGFVDGIDLGILLGAWTT